VSLGLTAEKLRGAGVETVGVVATAADRARRYFSYRPPRYLVAGDPDLASHRAFGLPRADFTEDMFKVFTGKQDDLARQSGLSTPPSGAGEALDRADGIDRREYTPDIERHQAQLIGQFLIDRDGVIRWTNIECERDGLEGLARFPTDDELLAAARAL
jgi:hypothetical protein